MPQEPDPFSDPNAPELPPMPTMAERRADYYEERYGEGSYYARRNRAREGGQGSPRPESPAAPVGDYGAGGMGPPAPVADTQPQASSGVGSNEMVAAIRELTAAVRGISGV